MSSRVVVAVLLWSGLMGFVSSAEDWEDPNDIFGRQRSSYGAEYESAREMLVACREELDAMRENERCSGPRVVKRPSPADRYLKRFLNLLLTTADFKTRTLGRSQEMRVNLDLYFNSKTLSVLQSFASDDDNGYLWSDLDSSLVAMFHNGMLDLSLSPEPSMDDSGVLGSVNHVTVLIAAVGSVTFCVIWLFTLGHSKTSSVFVGFVLVFSITFGWTWWAESERLRLVFMADLMQHADNLPDVCRPSTGWFDWLTKSSKEADCLKVLTAQNLNTMAAVDPGQVFKKTLTSLAFSWLPALASSVNDAVDQFYGGSYVWTLVARALAGPTLIFVLLAALFVFLLTRASFRVKTFLWDVEYNRGTRESIREPEPAPNTKKEVRKWKGSNGKKKLKASKFSNVDGVGEQPSVQKTGSSRQVTLPLLATYERKQNIRFSALRRSIDSLAGSSPRETVSD